MAPTLRTLTVQGLSLGLWDHAPGCDDLPVVLAIHGTLDTGRSFDRYADVMDGEARVLALDLRGHGQSLCPSPGASFHLLDFAKDLAVVVDQLAGLGQRPALLVGHSMGANILFMFAVACVDDVSAMLLVDGCGAPPEEGSDQPARLEGLFKSVRGAPRPFQPVASIDDAVERTRRWNPGLSEGGARAMLGEVLVPRDDGTFDFPYDPRLRGPTPFRFDESCWLTGAARIKAKGVPVIVQRASDGFLPEGSRGEVLGEPFGARCEAMGAEVQLIEGPHHLHVEAPEVLASASRALLGGRAA